MVSLGFGLAFVGAFALFATGWRLARADALEGWDVADIMLLRDERRRKRRIGPLDRAAKTLSPQLAILLGPRIVANLRRRIDLAGRPDGMTVDSFLQLVVKYGVVLGSVALVFLLLGNLLSMFLTVVTIPILPLSRLANLQRKRRTSIDDDLPDFLDVLAVTVGAGIGFRSALERVAGRFEGPLHEGCSSRSTSSTSASPAGRRSPTCATAAAQTRWRLRLCLRPGRGAGRPAVRGPERHRP